MTRLALFAHDDCRLHDMGGGHPEQPARLAAIERALGQAELTARLDRREAPLAEAGVLARAHPRGYVDDLFRRAPSDGVRVLDPDTVMTPHTLAAARRAAGAGIAAVDGVMAGEFERAFCSTRPPGHHAEHATAMGFCLFNNVAVAALHALEVYGLERVAICDFDVHHGNGTEDIFEGDSRVLFCSTFQHPFYPGKAGPSVPGMRVNCPLPAGTDGAGLLAAVDEQWLPALASHAPQLVLVSAGFDAHRADPLGGMRLSAADFGTVTRRILDVAERHAEGRIVSVLEGGYDLDALGRSVATHVAVLLD